MTWPWTKRHQELMGVINALIESQNKTNLAVMEAVGQMASTAGKQAEVLDSYLKLFKTEEAPSRWEPDPEGDNMRDLERAGFPKTGTEAEQAEWVLQHLDTA